MVLTTWPLVRERTIPTDDRHLLTKFSANFCGQRGVMWSARRIPYGHLSQFSRPEPLLFFQVAPHLLSQGLSGPPSRPTATQKIW
jgi:hypothetical protein